LHLNHEGSLAASLLAVRAADDLGARHGEMLQQRLPLGALATARTNSSALRP